MYQISEMDKDRKQELIEEKKSEVDSFIGKNSVSDEAKADIMKEMTYEAFTNFRNEEQSVIRFAGKVFGSNESMLAFIRSSRPSYLSATPNSGDNDNGNGGGSDLSIIDSKIAFDQMLTVEELRYIRTAVKGNMKLFRKYNTVIVKEFNRTNSDQHRFILGQ